MKLVSHTFMFGKIDFPPWPNKYEYAKPMGFSANKTEHYSIITKMAQYCIFYLRFRSSCIMNFNLKKMIVTEYNLQFCA